MHRVNRHPGTPPVPRTRTIALSATLLVLVGAAVYVNGLHAPFVYDDAEAIVGNPAIRHLGLNGLVAPASEGGTTVAGRPVLALSLAANYAISGVDTWSYHLVNVTVHAIGAVLLFGIVRRTLERTAQWSDGGPVRLASTEVAFFAALLWLVHPLQSQAVQYVVQRAESLMGVFYLLTLYAFVRAAEGHDGDRPGQRDGDIAFQRRRIRWLGVSVAACLLGMATKEVTATAPLAVLLYDRTFVAGSFLAALKRRRGYYAALAACWLLLLALLLSTGGNRGGTVGLGTGVPWWAYGLTQFQAVARYLALTVWPFPLIFEYGTFWVARADEILPYALIIVPLLVATAVALRRAPKLGFCGGWLLLILAPTSLAPGTLQMIVEHRMYLPLAGIVVPVVVGAHMLLGRSARFVLASVAAAFALATTARVHDYRSHLALWSDTVAKRPNNARARVGLAEAYEELGRTQAAIDQRRETIRLQPLESRYHYNFGLSLALAGRFNEAVQEYQQSLRLDPREVRAHNNLAIALGQLGRNDEALTHYEAVIRLQPENPQFHYNYGVALLRAGRVDQAGGAFEAALRLRPDHSDAHFNLGAVRVQQHRLEDALAHYEQAHRLRPEDAEFRSTLARAHAVVGDRLFEKDHPAPAASHYEAALQLDPNDAVAHHNLGAAYARLERWNDAEREFAAALRLKPDYAEARQHLRQLQQLRGR